MRWNELKLILAVEKFCLTYFYTDELIFSNFYIVALKVSYELFWDSTELRFLQIYMGTYTYRRK